MREQALARVRACGRAGVRDAWYQITDYNPRASSPTLGAIVFTLKSVIQAPAWISP